MDLSRLNQLGDMISELGVRAAAQKNDKAKIDDKSELNIFTSGWDAIQSKAKSEGADDMDMRTLDVRMRGEMADLMGVEFGKNLGVSQTENEQGEIVFSQEEISLENMMSLLADEDGIDMDKLREYSKKPVVSQADTIDALHDAEFSDELIEILVDEVPGVVQFVTDAIKDGSAKRIANDNDKTVALLDAGYSQKEIDAFNLNLLTV